MTKETTPDRTTTSYLIFPVGVKNPTRWDVVKIKKTLDREHSDKFHEERTFIEGFNTYPKAINCVIENTLELYVSVCKQEYQIKN